MKRGWMDKGVRRTQGIGMAKPAGHTCAASCGGTALPVAARASRRTIAGLRRRMGPQPRTALRWSGSPRPAWQH